MTIALIPAKYCRRLAALLLASVLLAACTVNPATGERNFTALMSPQQELQVGREQHPRILAQFGGDYDDAAIAAYIDRIGQNLARVSDLPNLDFTFTLLDSDVVNAFALPGGYVYVSRGLLALATSEAELAGVLARPGEQVENRLRQDRQVMLDYRQGRRRTGLRGCFHQCFIQR